MEVESSALLAVTSLRQFVFADVGVAGHGGLLVFVLELAFIGNKVFSLSKCQAWKHLLYKITLEMVMVLATAAVAAAQQRFVVGSPPLLPVQGGG